MTENDWKCPKCGTINPTFDPWCSSCEEPQPEAQSGDDDLPQATAYYHTHCDCPLCGEAIEFEGDVRGEELECDLCKGKFVCVS